jgi:CheY-like chemotaxis protein
MLTVNANESDVTKLITTRKLRVLLLDDDKFTLEFVGDMLLELGVAEVIKAENGEQGLAILAGLSPQPDILICDLGMPEMDGVSFLMHLGMQGYVGEVILISGTQKHLLSGMNMYVSKLGLIPLGTLIKPIERDELASVLTLCCQGNK